ncbi:2-hydroxyacid dehydrogenase [Sulfitobacter aestuarii]|uniref:2-hydroxyacid dehydrogenase n=1 Tax=Sulfitobacter aestuarii TaxID=2161676 RepID=A0ABW5U844_9RHOB
MEEISPSLPIAVHRGDPDRATLFKLLEDADVILNGHTYIDADLLRSAPSLKTIIFLGTGAASYIDMEAARDLGISVEVITNYGDTAVAEHTLALTLSAIRHVVLMDRDVRAGHWEPLEGREFSEMTVGVIGLGGIGRQFARLADNVGFSVLGWNRSGVEPSPHIELAEIDDLLSRSDVISLHLRLNDYTTKFLDNARLKLLPRDAIVVNTARAGLIDTDVLVHHLTEGTLGHAALDVFDHEPLGAQHALCELPNVTLTAHAGFKTRPAMRRLLEQALVVAGKVVR